MRCHDAHDGAVQIDVHLVVARDCGGRCDNMRTSWKGAICRVFTKAPRISDAERGKWQDVGSDVHICFDVAPKALEYEDVVRASQEHSTGLLHLVSTELYLPRPIQAPAAAAGVPAASQRAHA